MPQSPWCGFMCLKHRVVHPDMIRIQLELVLDEARMI